MAAMASYSSEIDSSIPGWAQRIITRMQSLTTPVNFSQNYDSLPAVTDKNIELTKKDKAVLNMTKIELTRLSKRI